MVRHQPRELADVMGPSRGRSWSVLDRNCLGRRVELEHLANGQHERPANRRRCPGNRRDGDGGRSAGPCAPGPGDRGRARPDLALLLGVMVHPGARSVWFSGSFMSSFSPFMAAAQPAVAGHRRTGPRRAEFDTPPSHAHGSLPFRISRAVSTTRRRQAVLPRIAPWARRPTSVTRPRSRNRGVELGPCRRQTRMSPASRSASPSLDDAGSPSAIPAEPVNRPARRPVLSRRYAPATISPSDVSTRGGVSARYDRTRPCVRGWSPRGSCARRRGAGDGCAIVTRPQSVRRILQHLAEPTEPPARAPARSPPFFQTGPLRRRLRGASAQMQMQMFEG